MLSKRILPVIGHLRLDQIKPLHVISFLTELRNEGSRRDGKTGSLSTGTIYYVHRVMKNVFSRAVEW
ncbi:N-terminal phage integrase SAM-like domain-containing protein [Paenibacillus sp. p3-SID1389]|uniref:N-terminal phage integrase SAM-like domain-containing protein n=1 Tax=Paenibacillus sp. p3-SID1389 TaxID=2916364 RepID=UPI0021A78287|nr:N-terminal phage integrase SAM-like domain-containing protein [Paenibacillus sp. p3-SID1389]MCT2195237.1 N-terminal phage integrase SAM-like domain-containing protein [Paenibacillus sp. p3-SID1389]